MIVCPVCEHSQQAGAECEVCGKRFAAGTVQVAETAPIEGLEPTLHADVGNGFEDAAPIPELEPTSAAPVDAPEPEITPGMEPTAAAPVDVDAPAIPDIERIQAEIPGDAPTELPVAPICRYCRTPAVPGEKMCSRCGMKLPVIDLGLVPAGTPNVHLCPNCGAIATREVCPACGNRLTTPMLE